MNPDEPLEPERDQPEAAIASVLRAELEANAAIGRCREEARAIVTEGQVEARAAISAGGAPEAGRSDSASWRRS